MTRKAAAQIGVSFTEEDLDLFRDLTALQDATRLSGSYIVRLALRAQLQNDKKSAALLESFAQRHARRAARIERPFVVVA